MTEYEIIDAICDSVNPVLLLVAIGVVANGMMKKNFSMAGCVFGALVGGLLLVYGIQFVDAKFGLWESVGSDYSTHSAFAIAVSIAISMGTPWGRWLMWVLVFYGVAMIYQQYHSWLDIGSTVLVIGGPLLLMRWYFGILNNQAVAKTKS